MVAPDDDLGWLRAAEERATTCLAYAAPALDPRYGIIPNVWDLPIDADDPRLFQMATGMAHCERLFGRGGFTHNGGAGLIRQLALASAVGETLERYSAAAYDADALVVASFDDLAGRGIGAIDPSTLRQFSPRQFATAGFPYQPYRRSRPISWTWGESLVSHQRLLVPAHMVFIPFFGESDLAPGISTGLACDVSPVGARLSGLNEVIERDAVMISWLAELPAPRVDIGRWPALSGTFHRYFSPSRLEFVVNDITTDLDVTVMFALAIDRFNEGLALTVGAAANVDPQVAAMKALVEAAQGRLWLKSQVAEGVTAVVDPAQIGDFDEHVRWFGEQEHLRFVDFLTTAPEQPSPPPEVADESAAARLDRVVAGLAGKGFDVVVVDVTPPDVADLGFSVVKVLVPGLVDLNADHRFPPLGNSRLYQVPDRLGYGPRREEDMNRVPHPFP